MRTGFPGGAEPLGSGEEVPVVPPKTELRCDGCGVEITWIPVLARGKRYCCRVCANGGECRCGYDVENEEDDQGAVGA